MTEILAVEHLTAGYGAAVAIEDISFTLAEGAALALLGRNGTGKTTLINSIVGLTRRFSGTVRLAGRDLTGMPPERRAAAGIGWAPQERAIFRSLSVEENLTTLARPGAWTAARIFSLFPRLGERRRNRGNTLSGGEQQILAVGRALVLNPRVILLDEPLEGLAPIIVEELLAALRRIREEEGTSAVIVEQKARKALGLADTAIILDRGRVVHRATSAELLAQPAVLDLYLGARQRAVADPERQSPT